MATFKFEWVQRSNETPKPFGGALIRKAFFCSLLAEDLLRIGKINFHRGHNKNAFPGYKRSKKA